MKGKYIIGLALDNIDNRRLEAILFAETMTHKHAAELFGFGDYVVSAGFFELDFTRPKPLTEDNTVTTAGRIEASVYGRSESLDIGPQDFDIIYVKRALGLLPENFLSQQERLEGFEAGLLIIKEREKKK